MRPTPNEQSQPTSTRSLPPHQQLPLKPDSTHSHHLQTPFQDDDTDCFTYEDQDLIKTQVFFQQTQNQQKIWRLFKSLDCHDCDKMYNNKERKPQIVCANNHLLCKSCYLKIRQTSLLCPLCGIRMNTKNTSSHESIQLFLKIYNQIFERQRTITEEKRKRNLLDFSIPKNIKTISVLLLIMVAPWIYDALKMIVCMAIEFEYRLISFVVEQVQEVMEVIKVVVQDEFYIGLYTNERGQYVFHSDEMVENAFGGKQGNSSHVGSGQGIFTEKHKAKIEFYLKFLYIAGFIWAKLTKLYRIAYEILRLIDYIIHFIILLAGVVQFPFVIPFILIKIEVFVPRKYRYKIGLYLDIIEEDNADEYLQPEDIQKLSKGELYFLLLIRNYIQSVMRLYKSIENDMKKRCEDLQYKKRMRLLKKNQKESPLPSVKSNKKFTF